jgi:glyoxylase-like metal-dependent hydrolase (beta-lactamase superfamily II)
VLTEIADGAWAYVQRDGGWGWSNAGLVVDGDASLLVDTLFDLELTAGMLEAMRRATAAAGAIDVVVNTHANGDHCYGNQLVAGAEIVASRASAEEMDAAPPSLLAGAVAAARAGGMGRLGEYVEAIFGSFAFDDIQAVAPTTTFEGHLELRVGDRPVHLHELGPAHTAGDVAVHLPDAGVVFTGDLVFHGNHPVVWAGPVERWIAACDRLLALDPAVVVPGHGPLSDRSCIEAQRGYLAWLVEEGTPRLTAGMSPLDAARDLAGGPYAGWGEGERLVANLIALAADHGLDPPRDTVTVLGQMAELWQPARSG